MSENIEILAGIMRCEYEEINETGDKQKIIERYFELWEDGKENGYIPVFVKVEDFFVEEFSELEEYEKLKSEILKKYKEIDCNKWFENKKEEYLENDYLEEEYRFSNNRDYSDYFKNYDGNKTLNLTSIFDEERKKIREDVALFKIPTNKVHEISGWFLFGGFNECPLPEEIISISK